MICKEVNGRCYWCFEDTEIEARKKFEATLLAPEAVDILMQALFKSAQALVCSRQEAWSVAKDLLKSKGAPDADYWVYNWLMGGFVEGEKTGNLGAQTPIK